uniref:Uncharacterized protein n=1 Tax=Onchocerca volvulus TaxID=6282 RepID=A0A8R1XZC6_ONCVO
MITKMKDNIVKKIDYAYVEALYKKIPTAYCQIFQGIIKGKKGTVITKSMAITKIELGSLAEQLLQFGDIITKNDDKKIKSQKQFEEFLTKIGKNDYVFVTCVVEHTLAGLSLTVGEAKILNVNSVPVTTVTDVFNAIHAALRKNGCVIIPFFNRTSSFCKQQQHMFAMH